jgi:hypothetical protein
MAMATATANTPTAKPATISNANKTPNKTPNVIPKSNIVAPSINNKSKSAVQIANNAYIKASELKPANKPSGQNANVNSNNSILTTKQDSGVYTVVSENYIILLGVCSAIVIAIVIYFCSQTFRVDRTIGKLQIYQGFQQITSFDYNKFGTNRLGNYYVSSAHNAAHCGYQTFDYTSEEIVLGILQSGSRYLEFNVFNSEFGKNAFPVVSMGYKSGEWKLTITDTPLEVIFKTIADNAFKLGDGTEGCNNPDDPVFIGLNLNTNSNLSCLNLIAYLITKYFDSRLLDNAYSFQNNDKIADITFNKVMGKVVFFSSDGFQGSGLEEIINYSWDNTEKNPNHAMQRLYYKDIITPGYDTTKLIDFNRNGLTIIVPNKEGDFYSDNYDSTRAVALGCQFIAMNFQTVDSNMDYYITKFKSKSFILKSSDLLKGNTNVTKPFTTIPSTTAPVTTVPKTTKLTFK